MNMQVQNKQTYIVYQPYEIYVNEETGEASQTVVQNKRIQGRPYLFQAAAFVSKEEAQKRLQQI